MSTNNITSSEDVVEQEPDWDNMSNEAVQAYVEAATITAANRALRAQAKRLFSSMRAPAETNL